MPATITAMIAGIKTTLAAADATDIVQGQGDLTESIEPPVVQIYFEDFTTDSQSSSTTQSAFKLGVQQTVVTFRIDIFVKQRQHIGEDQAAVLAKADAIHAVLKAQPNNNAFGVDGIKGINFRGERVLIEYGKDKYPAVSIILTVRTF